MTLKPKRRWIYAPAWVDYLCQFLIFLQWRVFPKLTPNVNLWAYSLLDKYCKCSRCQERKEAGLQ